MSMNVALFMILSGMCLIPALVSGAISDFRDRTFPFKYWEWPAKIGGIVTFIAYLYMYSSGWYSWIVWLILVSVVLSLVFYAMGLRFGSGGDWRALIYIALICPLLIIQTCVFSIFAGSVLAIWVMMNRDDLVPAQYRSVPFAVAILAGFLVSMLMAIVLWV
jgi:hypothetical protein